MIKLNHHNVLSDNMYMFEKCVLAQDASSVTFLPSIFALFSLVIFAQCETLHAGDVNSISIGAGTNIQDNSLVHVAKSNLSGKVLPTIIGNNVTVGEDYFAKK